MTQLFLDTEFNSFGGSLISMAIVGDNSAEWYEVADIPLWPNEWVAEHVIPVLGREPIGVSEFRRSLHGFLRHYDNPEIVCDWHADAEHFCASLAGGAYGSSLDYSCRITLLSGPSDVRPEIPHNALSDARALRDWYLAGAKRPQMRLVHVD